MQQSRVAVVSNDSQTRQETITCLSFIGENARQISPSEPLPDTVEVVFTDVADGSFYDNELPVVWLDKTGIGTVNGTFVATIVWPLHVDQVSAALHAAEVFRNQRSLPGTEVASPHFLRLVGASEAMQYVREQMGKVAQNDVTVLITGESGTGKEVVARALHDASHRGSGPFVPVNCGAIPTELLETELFGHEKGAFTGAVTAKAGRFELAEGGTLFLDEIGDMPLAMQVKLLRAIQERTYERVGGTVSKSCNVRLIAATHRDLEAMIREGSFREDLYYRINVFPIYVPPLRERSEDIPDLVSKISADIRRDQDVGVRFLPDAWAVLMVYGWPGNVRELANLVQRMTIQLPDGMVCADDLPEKVRLGSGDRVISVEARSLEQGSPMDSEAQLLLPINGIDLKEYLSRLEKSLITQALDDTNSVVARAADRLQIRRTTLVEKMRKYGLQRSNSRAL